MTAVQKHLGAFMLLLSCAAAQNSPGRTTLKNVVVAREGTDLRVEITLSAPVAPAAETAENPARILLDFPDTLCDDPNRTLSVNVNGVRRVRSSQHSTTPLVARVVLDLDKAHVYALRTEGNVVILTVNAAEKRSAIRSTPVPAASGNLIGIFGRHRDAAPVAQTQEDTPLPIPPPTTAGPAFEPTSKSAQLAAAPAPPAPAPQEQGATANPAGRASFEQNQIAVAKVVKPDIVPTEPSTAAGPLPADSADSAGSVAPSNAVVPSPDIPAVEARTSVAPASSATTTTAPTASLTPESTLIARSDDPKFRTVFRVKYVAEGVAYLEGGRAQGLGEGMKLEIEDTNLPAKQGDAANAADPRVVAELEVSAVAETSAVTDIHSPKRPVKVGDLAYLSSGDAEALVQQRALSATRQYPAVISFTEGDTLDEEVREVIPRPPLPSVNRARGRIGFDAIETFSHGTSSINSSDVGMVFRGDITRIGGTYWNLSGYWRGRLTKESAASQQTLQNLINRTYHLNMTYDNPNSTLVAGFGRLYLPWAPSLDTIDGGYFGKRLSKGTTLGIFGGSTPDPSSWDYSPNRVIGGSFINFEGGEYNGLHYSATSGAGISMVNWAIDRPFVFFEDSLSYKRDIAIYESAQIDSPTGNSVTPSPGPGLGHNFFTLRVNPLERVELDFNYNYFRDIPTFDPNLVGTGLLDKYLFQGFSAGGRVEVWKQVWLSTNLGRSSGTGDSKTSLNEMYGITFGRIPRLNVRADVHYARFNGSFGNGSYEAFSLSRQMSDRLRLEVLMGQQNFASTLTMNTRGRFVTGTVETTLGPHYYLQGNFTTNRGDMSYDQVMFSIGYRFDTKRRGE
jgi:AMIN domain-containing protein